ncbi:MAG: sigma 54-interacting transcriptional regulator [Myxococcales bacterium]
MSSERGREGVPETVEVQPHASPILPLASFFVQVGDDVRTVSLREGTSLTVGREAPADCVIPEASISRMHACFTLRADTVTVEDLGSTNGVTVAGQRVARAVLEHGDTVLLGSVRFTLTGTRPASEEFPSFRGMGSLRASVKAEIARAREFGRPFSLLALRTGDSAPNFDILDSTLRAVDVATLYTPDMALVLAAEMARDQALAFIRRLSGLGSSFAAGVAEFPRDATDLESLIECAVRGARTSKSDAVALQRSAVPADQGNIVVESDVMTRLYALVDCIAATPLSVLVLGETGVGKELVSRALHERSPRAKGPFVAVNCASIAPSLLESVLFGHEKGAFTGATERSAGILEQAHGGTVFLDEVGELSLAAQAALLRVIETKRVTRLGSTKDFDVDVRVVAATHRNLASMVANQTFRQDLMFRLDALTLQVPPLRERVSEIEPLALTFLACARSEWRVIPKRFSKQALEALRGYAFPGNVRELRNIINRAAVMCLGEEIGLDDLSDVVTRGIPGAIRERVLDADAVPPQQPAHPAAAPEGDKSFELRVQAFEAELIRQALERTGGNQSRAAVLLRMPRRTLTNKVHLYGLVDRGEESEF